MPNRIRVRDLCPDCRHPLSDCECDHEAQAKQDADETAFLMEWFARDYEKNYRTMYDNSPDLYDPYGDFVDEYYSHDYFLLTERY